MTTEYPFLVGPHRAWVLAATLAAGLLIAEPARAFNLGNLTTLSALGEPLRLEFEALDLRPDEVASFRVSLASPADFTARGLVYGPALEGMRMGLTRSANGRSVIWMEGRRPAQEPFVDLLLNITWASGATTRSVSVLLGPSPNAASKAELPLAPVATAMEVPTPDMSPAAPESTGNPAAVASAPSVNDPGANPPLTNTVVVAQQGDTAGALALRERQPGVEQSQYLVALVQVNPGAFVEGNVNRLQAGATLDLPTQAQATAIPASEARQIMAAQWQEFQAYRQQIATKAMASAPTAPSSPGPQAQGKVDSLAAAPELGPADKLTLSKPSAASTAQGEKALLDEREVKEVSARLEELTRTVRELDQLQTKAAESSSSSQEATSVLPTAQPAAKPAADSTLVDRLADHPAVLPVAGGLLALALAWLGLRLRRKVRPEANEFDMDLELNLDERWPRKSETSVSHKTEPALEELLDLEASPMPAKRASHS